MIRSDLSIRCGESETADPSNRSLEDQRRRIHAVPPASRRRAIVKHVSEVRVTPGARDSRPHAKTVVLQLGNIFPRDRLPEAGPTGARIELGLRREQRRITADAT